MLQIADFYIENTKSYAQGFIPKAKAKKVNAKQSNLKTMDKKKRAKTLMNILTKIYNTCLDTKKFIRSKLMVVYSRQTTCSGLFFVCFGFTLMAVFVLWYLSSVLKLVVFVKKPYHNLRSAMLYSD